MGKRVPLFLLEIARFAVWSWVGHFFSSEVFLLGFLYVETLFVKQEFFWRIFLLRFSSLEDSVCEMGFFPKEDFY